MNCEHYCYECVHFVKMGGHGSVDYGICPHWSEWILDTQKACKYFKHESTRFFNTPTEGNTQR